MPNIYVTIYDSIHDDSIKFEDEGMIWNTKAKICQEWDMVFKSKEN